MAEAPNPASDANSAGHLYLIDGSAYIFRAYHALPPMTRPDGTPVNAVLGFCNMMEKLLDDLSGADRPSHLAVIFDAARKTFRNEIYPEYKANRPPAPDDLVPQFDIVRQASKSFGLATIEMPGFEADDVIATYAHAARDAGMKATIVSSDKDLMQLVGQGVEMLDPMKNRIIRAPEVNEKFGVGPERVIDVQALCGDSVDNVPGVPGIGVKTAALLINEYGDLETLLSRAGEIKQNKRRENLIEFADLARLSKQLVTLKIDVELPQAVQELTLNPPDFETLFAFLDEQAFKNLKAKIASRNEIEVDDPEIAAAEDLATERRDYTCVKDLAVLEDWITRAYQQGYLAVDTETTSLNAKQAVLVGVSLSLKPGEACYIPLKHKGPAPAGELDLGGAGDQIPEQIDYDGAMARLKGLLEDPSILKIGQNIKYDMLVLRQHGIDLAAFDDTMLLSYVAEGGLHGHGMDELSKRHFSISPIPFKEIAGSGKSAITFDRVPLDKATEYAAEDADITLRLYQKLKPELFQAKKTTVYETMERALVPVLVAMEDEGIRVDPEVLRGLSNDFAQRMAGLETDIHELAGEKFNVNSPKQLGEILFEKMAIPGGKKTKTGAFGTGADVLERLAGEGHELPTKVMAFRQLAKLKSTYTDALQNEINPTTARVHTSYAMAATSTGRLASSDPNLQNIPIRTEEGRKIRRAFVPRQGCKLVSADYSQIELRILAHIADIAALKQAFHDGMDIHALTASQVFDTPVEGMDPMVRRQAKAINFGIIYGMSAFGLAQNLGISRTKAQQYIEAYFEKYPGIRAYMDDTIARCRETGYVETIFGRRMHMPAINEKNPQHRNFQERAAINAPIQGSAADVIRRAMVRLPDALSGAGLGAKMLLQVHDELIFDVPEAEVEATIVKVKQVMQGAAHLSVPLTVDAQAGDNWDEAH